MLLQLKIILVARLLLERLFIFSAVWGAVVHRGKGNTVDKKYSMTLKNQRAEGLNLTSSSNPLNKRWKKKSREWVINLSTLAAVCGFELDWYPGHKVRPCWRDPCPVPLCGGNYWQKDEAERSVSISTQMYRNRNTLYSTNTKLLWDKNQTYIVLNTNCMSLMAEKSILKSSAMRRLYILQL